MVKLTHEVSSLAEGLMNLPHCALKILAGCQQACAADARNRCIGNERTDSTKRRGISL